ncbi:hypothetical protein GPJ56_010910 [Histomonas meleagridis]|uniref:uncharacterized protein n=1 Tax=Histomonas meleagridis TaxID=135588 RepID=UPI00355A3123|nr:hypothetical protein GPJ56_010910 [Histomonas meleagridis]KAH0806289.1 hypothetical protein GO595_000977 [Histomonas meleagridis]
MVSPIKVETYEDFDQNVCGVGQNFVSIHNSSVPKSSFTQNVIYSDFPDTGYIPLIASLYSLNMPDYIFYINTSNVNYMPSTLWLEEAVSKFCEGDYDVIFGGKTVYQNNDVGIGLAIIRSPLVRELLYHTNSTYNSIPPLLSISLLIAKNPHIKSIYHLFDGIKPEQNYDHIINPQIPRSQMCPNINDSTNPTLGLLLPQFKRKYIYNFITDYEKQTLLPEFYCIVQCENRITLDLARIRSKSSRPVYHIWGYNWSPLFLFPIFISSLFPVDFVMRWDDDQSPIDNNVHQSFVDEIKNDNSIIGMGGSSYNSKSPKLFGMIAKDNCSERDTFAVPLMYRPMHGKLTARLRPYTLAQGEDITLSLASKLICNITVKSKQFKYKTYQYDWNKQSRDRKLNKLPENKEGDLMNRIYSHFIEKADYVPVCYVNKTKKDAYKKIEYKHSDYYE